MPNQRLIIDESTMGTPRGLQWARNDQSNVNLQWACVAGEASSYR